MDTKKDNLLNPEKWVDLYGDFLFKYALLHTKNPSVVEDLVQETFVAAINGMKDFKGLSSEKSWLVGILKHKIIDYFRSSSKEKNIIHHELSKRADGKNQESFDVQENKWSRNPLKATEQKEFMDVFKHCLSDLPERYHHIFELRDLEDLSKEEVCKILNISESNLWVMLHRARKKLKACMIEKWPGKQKSSD